MTQHEYLKSMVEVTGIFRDAAKLIITDTLDWIDDKLCSLNDLGDEDEQA